ncbi:MAG: preprotein translocase subunit YajC [Actinobacteria bacterium]|nr:preprotein translocase subunit YajC [Actinomycetota bacterium]
MDPLTLAMIAVLIVVGYFMIIRPQQKRTKAAAALQASIQDGSRVMMSGGIFGTVRHMGDKQVVVEVSPGVELTFVRQAIIRPLKDDEDEFEYADATEPSEVEVAPEADEASAFAAPATPGQTVAEDVVTGTPRTDEPTDADKV